MVERKCLNCGKKFLSQLCYIKAGRSKYCGASCYHKYISKTQSTNKYCANCGNEFKIINSQNKNKDQYCSKKCVYEKIKKNHLIIRECLNCGIQFNTTPSLMKRSSCNWCSRTCWSSYKSKSKINDTRMYTIWVNIKSRCNNISNPGFKDYGGRGIKYDIKWEKFSAFRDDMKKGYADNLSIDRIDNDGNYCKKNCRWSTQKEQANNTRRNIIFTINGTSKTLMEWTEYFNISYSTVHSRIKKLNWDIEKALITLVRVHK